MITNRVVIYELLILTTSFFFHLSFHHTINDFFFLSLSLEYYCVGLSNICLTDEEKMKQKRENMYVQLYRTCMCRSTQRMARSRRRRGRPAPARRSGSPPTSKEGPWALEALPSSSHRGFGATFLRDLSDAALHVHVHVLVLLS